LTTLSGHVFNIFTAHIVSIFLALLLRCMFLSVAHGMQVFKHVFST